MDVIHSVCGHNLRSSGLCCYYHDESSEKVFFLHFSFNKWSGWTGGGGAVSETLMYLKKKKTSNFPWYETFSTWISRTAKGHFCINVSLHFCHVLPSVGNKNDDPNSKVVETNDAQKFAEQMGISLFETSAKENVNVEEVSSSGVCLRTIQIVLEKHLKHSWLTNAQLPGLEKNHWNVALLCSRIFYFIFHRMTAWIIEYLCTSLV